MPKKRPPSETWNKNIRPVIWNRDGRKCVHCGTQVTLRNCHIDHIISGVTATNKFSNLRTLCYKCHVLRADPLHRGMVQQAIKGGIIPPRWRNLIWDEIKIETEDI
ncbi:HNH endonuclease [Bacillus sp. 1P02SD]|uniref:HNH endonuclease n=1 Tax=Bacillus sp. 1P02SD TaxID=3132264 RepID=UPI0039A2CDAE